MAELWPGGPITLPHTFTHDGIELTVSERPATELLYWLSGGQWWRLYPDGVDQEALEPLRMRLFDPKDNFDLIHMWTVSTTLFGRMTGLAQPRGPGWWPGVRLANRAITHWPHYHGWCAGQGIDVVNGTLMTAISAAYAWTRAHVKPEDLPKLDQELWQVPTVASAPASEPEAVPEHVREAEAAAFFAAMGETLPGQVAVPGVH